MLEYDYDHILTLNLKKNKHNEALIVSFLKSF